MPKHDHLHTLPITERYPEEVWRAVNFAAHAHETQIRKMSGNHYIEHPFGVLELVRTVTDDVDVQRAAVLHDTVEDTWVTFDELDRRFGERTERLVWGVTKDDSIGDWHDRNQAYLDRLSSEALDGSVIIALADKIHNLTDMIASFAIHGDAMWQQFSAQADDQLWWYNSVLVIGKERLPDCVLVDQLGTLVDIFRSKVVGRSALHAGATGV